jgi:hypothetical protein
MRTCLPVSLLFALALACAAAVLGDDEAVAVSEEQLAAQQYLQLMQPLMWRELEFVRLTCDLKPEQRPRIKAAAEKSAKQAAQDQAAQDTVQGQRAPQDRGPVDASSMIRKGIANALEETLTAEQFAAYAVEAAWRTDLRKQAAIASVVAQLDEAMYLTKEQRGKIASSLDTNWQDDWEKWLMMWKYAGRYFPKIPDQHITPHLSEKQIKIWGAVQKIDANGWGGPVKRQAADDGWWEGDARKSEAKASTAQAGEAAAERE